MECPVNWLNVHLLSVDHVLFQRCSVLICRCDTTDGVLIPGHMWAHQTTIYAFSALVLAMFLYSFDVNLTKCFVHNWSFGDSLRVWNFDNFFCLISIWRMCPPNKMSSNWLLFCTVWGEVSLLSLELFVLIWFGVFSLSGEVSVSLTLGRSCFLPNNCCLLTFCDIEV